MSGLRGQDLLAGPHPSPTRGGVPTLRVVLWMTGILLGLASFAVFLVPTIRFAVEEPSLDLALNAIATAAAAAIATLAWFRFREVSQTQALFFAAAFVSLCLANLLVLLIVVLGLSEQLGFLAHSPGQAPLYLWTAQRAAAAALLLGGGLVGMRNVPATAFSTRAARAIVLVPGIILLGLSAGALAIRDQLPQLVTPTAITSLAAKEQVLEQIDPNPVWLALQLPIGLAFLVAMVLYARLFARSGQVAIGAFAIAFLTAAFGQLHFALVPGTYTTLVTSSDVIRMGFYGVLLIGLTLGAREDLRSLRQANERLEHLREADAARAVAEERARLAREIHDGLVQDLWLARFKQTQLLAAEALPTALRSLASEVADALETAQAEAREALEALAPVAGGHRDDAADTLERFARATAERFDLDLDYVAAAELPALSGSARAPVFAILREALANVRKHADATRVKVVLERTGQDLLVSVTDNGAGFDVDAARRGRGLDNMRARAREVGGSLEIDSRPMDGTRVRLRLPASAVSGAPQPAGAAPAPAPTDA